MSPNPYRKDTSIINNDETNKDDGAIEMSDFSMALLDEPCDPMIQEREQETPTATSRECKLAIIYRIRPWVTWLERGVTCPRIRTITIRKRTVNYNNNNKVTTR